MTLKTNLEVGPYYDDYRENKDFYKVLFKPGVPVQARELNQLQSILQNQIERFGDNIFQKGTIVDGCHITYHDTFPYIKIKDTDTQGNSLDLASLEGFFLKNSSNLQAYVVKSITGFESQAPDLNTLYIKYLNSGTSTTDTAYTAAQVLTVFKPDYRIYDINIVNGSQGFSNTDSVVIVSALAIQNSAGGTSFANGFYVGDYLSNGKGANVQVTSVDTTTNTSVVILSITPRLVDLQQANTAKWSIFADDSVVSSNTGGSATVVDLVGSGTSATLSTTTTGKVNRINIQTNGSGYYVAPFISARTSSANTLQLTNLSLTPQNFLHQVTVAPSLTTPVGSGYGLTVSDGVIFQQGFFQRVNEQLVIVEKYSIAPDSKVVGFDTSESIINSNIDESLLDNAAASPNYTAPGADRLKLSPELIVLNKTDADANTDFFSIVEFAEGSPYKQNKLTQYNVIAQEMARRTYEESGNYVIDQFNLNTKSPINFSDESTKFGVQIDPGLAYIKGNRVETLLNYNTTLFKATDTLVSNNATISLDYGSYIKVNEYAGYFNIDTSTACNLYSATRQQITNFAGVAISDPGSQYLIGTARVRSVVLESGTPGSSNAVYRIYLYDILMNAGRSFKDVKCIYETGGNGIADTVIVNNRCVLYDTNHTSVCFPSGFTALKNANNLTYTYKTFNTNLSCNTSGQIQKTLGTGETFELTGVWTDVDRTKRLVVVPLANVTASSNTTGSVVSATNSANLAGTSTSFTTEYNPGDYIKFANSTVSGFGRVQSITNNTLITLSANASVAITGANVAQYFPMNIPVNMVPSIRTANVSANGSVLTIYLGAATNSANVAVAYNVVAANVQPVSETVNRNCYVRIQVSNNAATTSGPWCLGMPNVFRMKGVFKGSNTTFIESDSGITDVTTKFYIDHNQNENYYDTSYLFLKPNALTISSGDVFLVKLDVLTLAGEGLKTLKSFPINDSLTLANSVSTINTLEIPEFYDRTDQYYDLRDQMDFRPAVTATATISNNVAVASVNPIEPSTKFTSNAKKFPSPGTTLSGTFEYYLPRIDRVIVTADGNFKAIAGISGKTVAPSAPGDSLTINTLEIAPYPSIPYALSNEMIKIADTKVACGKYTNQRISRFRINAPITPTKKAAEQPRGYTMSQIGQLESRLNDIEYYLAAALAQLSALTHTPTNTDGTIRTRYGYFSDSFEDASGLDLQNPEFAASVINGRLVPKVSELNIEFQDANTGFGTGDIITLPYTERSLISQLVATDGSIVTSGNTAPDDCSPNTVPSTVQVITSVIVTNENQQHSPNWTAYEDREFLMSANSGPVGLYFNSRDDDIAIEIYQGSTSGFSLNGKSPIYTAQNATALTSTDIQTKTAKIITPFNTLNGEGFQGSPSKYVVDESGKILWTHTPSGGRYYKVRFYKQYQVGDRFRYEYRIWYPIDQIVNACTPATPTPTSVNFTGYVNSISPTYMTIQASTTYSTTLVPSTYFSDSQKFTISVSGLKPLTTHAFYIDGVDKSSNCQQVGKALGATMITDSSGVLQFDFYYDAGITEVTSNLARFNQMATNAAGSKTFNVKTSDNMSQAVGTFLVKSYASDSGTSTPAARPSTTLTGGGASNRTGSDVGRVQRF